MRAVSLSALAFGAVARTPASAKAIAVDLKIVRDDEDIHAAELFIEVYPMVVTATGNP